MCPRGSCKFFIFTFAPLWLSVEGIVANNLAIEEEASVQKASCAEDESVQKTFCANPKPNERYFLIGLNAGYHGSSSLQSVLMSSEQLTTLCGLGTRMCEGKFIFPRGHGNIQHPSGWNMSHALEIWTRAWNLSRPIFFDKSPTAMMDVSSVYKKIEDEVENTATKMHVFYGGMRSASLPQSLTSIGVNKISLGYILLWRPTCLSYMSSTSTLQMKNNLRSYMEKEMMYYQQHVKQLQFLDEMDLPVLVVNYGDLLWKGKYTKSRLEAFLPCAGEIDLDYLPPNGKDGLCGRNHWKIHESVQSYADSHRTKALEYYDVEKGVCKPGDRALDVLSKEELQQMSSDMDILRARS